MIENPVASKTSSTTAKNTKPRNIKKATVLGSGLMGMGIAAHLANVGVEVLLLDIVPFDLTDEQKKVPAMRNKLANGALKAALKSTRIEPFYKKDFAKRVTTGNFDDDMEKISDSDWIIEVVVERLDIKKQVFDNVEKHRKPGSLITSNTSGIPIHMMLEGRSDDFKKHFCGTHFFNPPRYMRLFEVIPSPKTDPAADDFFMDYGDKYLGKQTVLAKDTPAFVANRVGVYAMAKIYQLTEELGLSISEVDKLTGPAIGRPKTGTFRLGDLVGHDTSAKVIAGIKDNCPNDEQAATFVIPKYYEFLLENKFLGDKTGQGFYKKTKEKDENGRKIILGLDLKTLEYKPTERPNLPSLKAAKDIENLGKRVNAFVDADDKGGELVKRSLGGLFAYVSNRIPEIADDLYSIDDALRAGFAWEVGPFEYWDMVGISKGIKIAEADGQTVAQWVKDMVAAGHESFYTTIENKRHYYSVSAKNYRQIPGADEFIILDTIRDKAPVNKTSETILHDIGDGVLCLEFTSKMNSLGEGVLKGINEAITIAEEQGWKGLVIGNDATNFTVGANLMMVGMMAMQGEWEQMNFAVKTFQDTIMRCRYSSVPVVAATQGYVFGGGCEMIMHCDAAMCAAESYIGLVEVGVGLIPGGAGTKEFAVRASDAFFAGDVQMPTLIDKTLTIAQAKVATSAPQAFDMGYLLEKKDHVVMNAKRNIMEAKVKVIELSRNYRQPIMRKDITVMGRAGIAAIYSAANELILGNYASEHDVKIAKKLAYVICGGDLTGQQQVSEQYLLDIEREAFISLAGEKKTQERISHMLQTNKPLRN